MPNARRDAPQHQPAGTAARATGAARNTSTSSDSRSSSDHAQTGLDAVTDLQREAGNRAVADLIRAISVQRDLKINDGPTTAIGHLQQQLNATGSATPRLAVTGLFDAATETAVKQFEKNQGVAAPTGIVDDALQKKLDKLAPVVSRGDQKTVDVGMGNVLGQEFAGGRRPLTKRGMSGPAVKELQERLNNTPTMSEAARKARNRVKDLLNVDGQFGTKTHNATAEFQKDNKLDPDGRAGPITWSKLEQQGAAKQGRVEFEWREEVEGVGNVGGRAKYEWKLDPDRLLITAKINFIPKNKGVEAKIGDWLQEIKDIWGTFHAVNKKDPTKKIKVDFEAVRGKGDFNVNVIKDGKRSDAANWHTLDNRRGLAAHEFGHLLGLADEYNRDEGQYLATTGEEPPVGDVTNVGDKVTADALANAIKGAMPLVDDGTTLAGIVTAQLAGKQGGFSKFVAMRYFALFGTEIVSDMKAAFVAKNAKFAGFHGPKTDAVTPFLYSTGGIMGTMVTAGPGAHDHPVEPRHIKPFTDIVTREHSLAQGAKDEWEPKRR